MALRIGIDYTAGVNQGAGIGRYTRSLVAAVAELDHTNEYVLFYSLKRGGASPHLGELHRLLRAHPNFSARRAPLPERAMTILWHRLHIPCGVDQFTGPLDVFHSPDFVAAPQRRGRSIVTIHDLSFLAAPDCAEPSLRKYLRRAVWDSVRKADSLVAVSANTKADLVRLLRIPGERIDVVPNGTDERFSPVTEPERIAGLRAQLGLNEPYILTVGTLEPRKNLVRLLEAYRLLRDRGMAQRLVIAGRKGWLYGPIFEAVNRLDLGPTVTFLDFVDDADLPALYSAAEAFVYPSIYEGFGIPPLEAMACGTPVIASNTSSLPEVLDKAAILVDPVDTRAIAWGIDRVLNNKEERESLIRAGRERAAMFPWIPAAAKLIEIYQRKDGRTRRG